MVEPVTLGVLGSWAALEGVKFLYGQAAEVIKTWRGRRAEDRDKPLEVPITDAEILDGRPTGSEVDLAVLTREGPALAKLVGVLAPYAEGLADIDTGDAELAEQAGQVRAVLEALYGQRLTLRGEQRDPTGTRVTVRQVLGDVRGAVIGVEAEVRGGGDVSIDQEADTVGDGASMTGFRGTVSG